MPIKKSIIVGLGGTGTSIVLDIRKRLIERYENINNVPMVQFLCLDTEDNFTGMAEEDDQMGLTLMDRMARLDDVDTVWMNVSEDDSASLREQYERRDYLSENEVVLKDQIMHITDGAGAIRMRGRIAFIENYQTIRNRLQAKQDYLTVTGAGNLMNDVTRLRNAGRPVPGIAEDVDEDGNEQLTYYLVGSLFGGTGAGCFIDCAYLVQDVARQRGDVIGYFLLPSSSAEDDRWRASVYASLTELNHFSYDDVLYTAKYQNAQIESQNRPFRFCYIVEEERLSHGEAMKAAGESIFLELDESIGSTKVAQRDNFRAQMSTHDDCGAPRSYLSFGLSSIHCPFRPVLNHLSARLGARVARDFIPGDEAQTEVGRAVERRLSQERLMPEQLISQIINIGEPLEKQLNRWVDNYDRDEVMPVLPELDTLVRRLDSARREQMQLYSVEHTDPRRWGELARQMHVNVFGDEEQTRRGLIADIRGATTDSGQSKVSRMISDVIAEENITRALTWIKQLKLRIDRWRSPDEDIEENTTSETGDDSNHRIDAVRDEIESLADDPRVFWSQYADKARQERETYLKAARDDIERAAKHAARNLMQAVYDEMASELSRLIDDIERLQGRMEKTHTNLQADARRWRRMANTDQARGVTVLEDADVDEMYNRFSTPNRISRIRRTFQDAHNVGDETTASPLGTLSGAGEQDLQEALFNASKQDLRDEVAEEMVALDRFFSRYRFDADDPAHSPAGEQISRCLQEAVPYIQTAHIVGYNGIQAQDRARIISVAGAGSNSDNVQNLRTIISRIDIQDNFSDITDSANPGEVVFHREYAAFPIRALSSLGAFERGYEQRVLSRGGLSPIHARADIKPDEWRPIEPPHPDDIAEARELFIDAFLLGAVERQVAKS
ncbi:MAG: tubulin-like doman-containing protein, partial [Armatimonadota bacterium]